MKTFLTITISAAIILILLCFSTYKTYAQNADVYKRYMHYDLCAVNVPLDAVKKDVNGVWFAGLTDSLTRKGWKCIDVYAVKKTRRNVFMFARKRKK